MAGNILTPGVRSFEGSLPAPFGDTIVRPLLIFLAASGMAELIFLRTFSRIGIHIPKEGMVLAAYNAITSFGSFAFNLATVLAILALGLLLYLWLRERYRSPLAWIASGVIALMLSLSVILPLAGDTASVRLLFSFSSVVAMVLLVAPYAIRREAPLALRVASTVVLVSYLCAQYYIVVHTIYELLGLNSTPPLAVSILGVGEALVVVNAVLVFLAWGRRSRLSLWHLALPTAVTLLLLGSYTGNGSTSSILALWMEGLTLYLPFPVYLLALWLYLLTIVSSLSRRNDLYASVGLILLLVAGYALETTYQHLLAILALMLLTSGSLLSATESEVEPGQTREVGAVYTGQKTNS